MSDELKEYRLDDGTVVKLGNIAPPAGLVSSWPVYGKVPNTPVIPRDEWVGLIDAMGQGPEVGWEMPYVHDQQDVGMCFPRGTLVRMGDGSQKPIEKVQVLDEVLTAEGNVKRVLRTMVRQEQESLYRLHVWGHRHLKATAEHPVLTDRGYVKMAELKSTDFVAIPRFAPAINKTLMTADYVTAKRVKTTRDKYVEVRGIPGKPSVTITRIKPPDVIHLTRDFGWIVGMFLAEGCTSAGKVTWVLSITEADTHGAELVRLIREVFGAEANLRTNPAQNTTIVSLYGIMWAELFEAWCAKGCDGKQLHSDLTSGGVDFLEGVLAGWTDGDGLGDNQNGGVTVSHALAVQMFDVANALGHLPTLETLDAKASHGVRARRRRHIVKWGKNPDNTDPRRRQDDKTLWRRVDGVVREDFTGWVYNIEVEDDHSYVAEGIGVHNCNASATASAMESARAKQGLPVRKLSGGDLYRRICFNGRDSGSLLEDGIREAMAEGIATVKTCPYMDWKNDRAGAAEERKQNKVLEAFLCPTFDACMSAVLSGFDLISGIMWYDSYFKPGADGWLPSPSGGAGGHALHSYKATYKMTTFGTTFGIWTKNSWKQSWGRNGHCVLPEKAFAGQVSGWWAVRAVTDEGGVVPQEQN